MFTSLLPGIRDLRTPLAAGFLWMTLIWLIFEPTTLLSATSTGYFLEGYRVFHFLGATAVIAVLAFVAYLIGIVVTYNIETLVRFFAWSTPIMLSIYPKPIRKRFLPTMEDSMDRLKSNRFVPISPSSSEGLRMRSMRAFGKLQEAKVGGSAVIAGLPETRRKWVAKVGAMNVSASKLELIEHAMFYRWLLEHTYFVRRDLINDLPNAARQLLVANKDVFENYDRAKSEAEFRFGITIPLALVAVYFAAQIPPHYSFWSLVLAIIGTYLILIVFYLRAIQKLIEANDIVCQAVLDNIVTLPALKILEDLAEPVNHTEVVSQENAFRRIFKRTRKKGNQKASQP